MIERQSKFEILVDALNLVLGTFLVLAPWTFGLIAGFPEHSQTTAAVLDAWAAGATIGLTAAAAIVAFAEWQEWSNFFVGLWTIGAPWFLGFGASPGARWVHVGVGAAVAALAGFELFLLDRRFPARPDRILTVIDATGDSAVAADVAIARERRPVARPHQSVVIPFPSDRRDPASQPDHKRAPGRPSAPRVPGDAG
jgi:hypothetical protein